MASGWSRHNRRLLSNTLHCSQTERNFSFWASSARIFLVKSEKIQRQKDGKKRNDDDDDEIWNFIWSKKNFYLISLSLPFKLNLDLLGKHFSSLLCFFIEGHKLMENWKIFASSLVSFISLSIINWAWIFFSFFFFSTFQTFFFRIDFHWNNQSSRVEKLASFCICFKRKKGVKKALWYFLRIFNWITRKIFKRGIEIKK